MASPPSPPLSTIASTSSSNGSYQRPLEGRLALITGASRGIGAAIAQNLASKGASLILNYNSLTSSKPAATLANSLSTKYSITAISIQGDMTSPTSINALLSTAQSRFTDADTGVFQIDILINNAGGVRNGVLGAIMKTDYDFVFNINVLGPLLVMQAVLPFLPHDRSGRIVNISSISSSAGFIGQSIYGASKAALEAFTRTWARELAERGTVNAVNPGPVMTDMWGGLDRKFREDMSPWVRQAPMAAVRKEEDPPELVEGARILGGRPAYTEEVAGVVGMLCTKDSVWCTGQVVCANGGMRMSD